MKKHCVFVFVLLLLLTLGCTAIDIANNHDEVEYDVVVVGSDPEGIAAAVSAARNGLKTLLLDTRTKVGGLYTLGQLNTLDMNYKRSKSYAILNNGIFREFFLGIDKQVAFDISLAQSVFEDMLATAEVEIRLNVSDIQPLTNNNKVEGVSYLKQDTRHEVRSKVVIDSTQNADIAALAGIPFLYGREELGLIGEIGPVTLVFKLNNVDWDKVMDYLNHDDDPMTGANQRSAWGYEVMYTAPTQDESIQIRGLNAGRQDDGTVLINALQIFDVDPFDQASIDDAIRRATLELEGLIKYINDYCVGFEEAELVGVAEELYIRESRHLEGMYKLTADDIFEHRNQAVAIAYGSYPIDIQSTEKGQRGTALCGTSPYGIPFGVMVPTQMEGILIASRCAGYTTIAHGSARTVPVGMALGQAAGVAAKLAIEHGLSFQELDNDEQRIQLLRTMLMEQGVDLTPIELSEPEMSHWSYPYIKYLRNRAMLSKGYDNDYKIEQMATVETLDLIFKFVNYNSALKLDRTFLDLYKPEQKLGITNFLEISNKVLALQLSSVQDLLAYGLIDDVTLGHLVDNKGYLTNGEVYALMAGLIKYISH